MGDEEESYESGRKFSRTSSFSSLRWSECLGTIAGSKTDIERTNLLTLFLAQHEKITGILRDNSGGNSSIFGRFRLGLVQIIQVTVFAGDDKITEQVIKSELIRACIFVFFAFPKNNIMHEVVQDIVVGILQRNDDTLVYHLLKDTDLVQNIVSALQDPGFEYSTHRGHILLMVKAILESKSASLWIKKGKLSAKWEECVKPFTPSS